MGVIRWFDRIDPERWSLASRLMCESPPTTSAEADAFLSHFDIESPGEGNDGFEDAEDEEGLVSARNELFEKAVTIQTWEVDKAFSCGLEEVLNLLPDGHIVGYVIVGFAGMDLDVPQSCNSLTGLYGACSPESIRLPAGALKPIAELDSIRAIAERQVTGWKSIFDKRQKRAKDALKILEGDDYISKAWKEFTTAVEVCVSNDDYLGLGMSP